jgi:hypothetical protein
MGISIKTDLDWETSIFYLKSDPDQLEHRLVAVIILPGKAVKFRLSYMGEITEVYDFEATQEKDELKTLADN